MKPSIAHELEHLAESFARIPDQRVRYFFSMLADCLAECMQPAQEPAVDLNKARDKRRRAAA